MNADSVPSRNTFRLLLAENHGNAYETIASDSCYATVSGEVPLLIWIRSISLIYPKLFEPGTNTSMGKHCNAIDWQADSAKPWLGHALAPLDCAKHIAKPRIFEHRSA
jgi:hypothetical protein